MKALLQQSSAPFSSRHRIRTTSGETRRVVVVGDAVTDASGRTVATRGFYVDVTEAFDADLQHEVGDVLQVILDHRAIIEQAKGMLMAIYDVSAEAAFSVLKWRSQELNVKLHDLAARLVADMPSLLQSILTARTPVDRYLITFTVDETNTPVDKWSTGGIGSYQAHQMTHRASATQPVHVVHMWGNSMANPHGSWIRDLTLMGPCRVTSRRSRGLRTLTACRRSDENASGGDVLTAGAFSADDQGDHPARRTRRHRCPSRAGWGTGHHRTRPHGADRMVVVPSRKSQWQYRGHRVRRAESLPTAIRLSASGRTAPCSGCVLRIPG